MSDTSRPIERESVPAVDADQAAALAEGLSELELPFRATLELRYRRGLPDETIAAVAQLEEPEIVRQRSRALVWLAQRAGIEGPDAIDAVEGGLTLLWEDPPAAEPEPPAGEPVAAPPGPEHLSEPEPEAPPVPPAAEARTEQLPLTESVPPPSVPPPLSRTPAAPLPTPKPFPSPRAKPKPKKPKKVKKPKKPKEASEGSNRRLIALLALAAAVVVLFIVLTSGGSDDATTGGAAPTPSSNTTSSKGDKPTSDVVTMQMLPGVEATGSIDLTMSGDPATPELDMKLKGLPDPDGEYRAWLYNSVIDSRSLGKAQKGDGEVKVTLPEGWQDFKFVDVSVQDPGSIAHSGKSVSRISTADLPQP